MRRDLLKIVACPVCKYSLDLNIVEESGEEIIEGSLTCTNCNEIYPIESAIPNLLPPELRKSRLDPL
jgi:uncharacterized protein YbaR (Trm112 family)